MTKKTILTIAIVGILVIAGLNLVLKAEVDVPKAIADIIVSGIKIRFNGKWCQLNFFKRKYV